MADINKKPFDKKARRVANEDLKINRLHVGMSETMFKKIHAVAERKGLQTSTLVRLLITEYLKKEEK